RLNAHFSGSEGLGLERAPDDFVDVEEVSLFAALSSREGAETARLGADIGEVDVSIDDVADLVADLPAPELIRGRQERVQVATIHRGEQKRTVDFQSVPFKTAVEQGAHVPVGRIEELREAHDPTLSRGTPNRARSARLGACSFGSSHSSVTKRS